MRIEESGPIIGQTKGLARPHSQRKAWPEEAAPLNKCSVHTHLCARARKTIHSQEQPPWLAKTWAWEKEAYRCRRILPHVGMSTWARQVGHTYGHNAHTKPYMSASCTRMGTVHLERTYADKGYRKHAGTYTWADRVQDCICVGCPYPKRNQAAHVWKLPHAPTSCE